MVLRNIVKIDENKCNGCANCVSACVEGAIKMINGKAKLISETYCDGLGACIGHCPQDAITVEQRECAEFDEKAVEAFLEKKKTQETVKAPAEKSRFACPGIASKTFENKKAAEGNVTSQLSHWPIKLKLISPKAPFLDNANLLITADCVAFAMGNFHSKLLKNSGVLIACPKLDDTSEYVHKLAEILRTKTIKSLSVVHMEVPCCSGLLRIIDSAIVASGKAMNYEDITISLNGELTSRQIVNG